MPGSPPKPQGKAPAHSPRRAVILLSRGPSIRRRRHCDGPLNGNGREPQSAREVAKLAGQLPSYDCWVRLPAFVHHRLSVLPSRCEPVAELLWPNAGSPKFRRDPFSLIRTCHLRCCKRRMEALDVRGRRLLSAGSHRQLACNPDHVLPLAAQAASRERTRQPSTSDRCGRAGRQLRPHQETFARQSSRRIRAQNRPQPQAIARLRWIGLREGDPKAIPPIGPRQPFQAHLGCHIPKAHQGCAYQPGRQWIIRVPLPSRPRPVWSDFAPLDN